MVGHLNEKHDRCQMHRQLKRKVHEMGEEIAGDRSAGEVSKTT